MTFYEYNKSHGICVQCACEDAVKGKTRCVTCLEKNAEYQRKKIQKETDEQRQLRAEKNKVYQRELYRQRKEAGLCVACGKPQSAKSTVYCIDHAIKNQRGNNKRKKSGIERHERKSYGKCYVCNEPVGTKCNSMCDKCYAMVCANLPQKMHQSLYMMHKQQNKAVFGG